MIPQKTSQIFELLSRGKFICDNYPNDNHRILYNIVEKHYDELYDYFIHIGYKLSHGIGYFYFSKDENINNIDNKINTILYFIDLLDLIYEYNPSFCIGTKITPSTLVEAVNSNSLLKSKIPKKAKKDTLYQSCKKVLDDFVSKGVMAIENEEEELYITLSSLEYIEKFIESIKEINDERA